MMIGDPHWFTSSGVSDASASYKRVQACEPSGFVMFDQFPCIDCPLIFDQSAFRHPCKSEADTSDHLWLCIRSERRGI